MSVGGSISPSACLTTSSTCSGGSSRCGRSTTEGAVPVLHSYTVQFPRSCTKRSIGNTCSSGLQQSTGLIPPLPAHEATRGFSLGHQVRWTRLPGVQVCQTKLKCHVGDERTAREKRQTFRPAREKPRSLPFTHKPHTGLVQVNGFPEGLSSGPNRGQLTWQLLHQGQQFSSDTVSLERIAEAD